MPSPLLFHSCSDEMEAINLPGAPLGFMKEIKLKSRRIRLESGDKLILLSDGFHERMNGNDEIWKYGATQEELLKICRDESKPGEIANRLIEASDRFAGGRANDDDMTVIVVSVK
jgi:serine phosphatase RsbU (regulator of sigma subunit)